MMSMTISNLIDFLDTTEIALKPRLDDPNEYLAAQSAFFAMHIAKLIRKVEKGEAKEAYKHKLKEAFLVAEFIHNEADHSVDRKFQKIYSYCLQAQVDLREHPWVLDLMPPEMKAQYRKMFDF